MALQKDVYTAPYLPTPENPRQIRIGSRQLHEYASPELVLGCLGAFSRAFRLNAFEACFINIQGGLWLAKKLKTIQDWPGIFVPIRYCLPKNGDGVDRLIPIPEEMRDVHAVIIEDVRDRGRTIEAMIADCPRAVVLTAVHKRNVPNQVIVPNTHVMIEADNKWLGSVGMNIDDGPDQQAIRNFDGVTFKP